jgi:hypothetical protein
VKTFDILDYVSMGTQPRVHELLEEEFALAAAVRTLDDDGLSRGRVAIESDGALQACGQAGAVGDAVVAWHVWVRTV